MAHFITLHVKDPEQGEGEALVNIDNVLFILRNHAKSMTGSIIAFHEVEGDNELWVIEDLAQIKELM